MFDGVEDDVSTTCSASSIAVNGPLSYGRKFINVWPATVIRIELCVLLNILAFDGSGAVRETKKGGGAALRRTRGSCAFDAQRELEGERR